MYCSDWLFWKNILCGAEYNRLVILNINLFSLNISSKILVQHYEKKKSSYMTTEN